jgi:hypothetical protein
MTPAAQVLAVFIGDSQQESNMRLHTLHYTAKETNKLKVEWFGTEREAIQRRGELFASGVCVGLKRQQMIYPVDVPMKKEDLLDWLRDQEAQRDARG